MSAEVDGLLVTDLDRSGLFAHPSATAEMVERFGVPGSADPARVLLSRVLGGFENEVLASRGLDIGYASWRGVPLSWRSPVQDARPVDQPSGSTWLSRFTGGLLTTCGPFNIGGEHGDQGLHGDFSHRPAGRVASGSRGSRTWVTGTVEAQHMFGASVTIDRSIESEAGPGFARIAVTDTVENTGRIAAPVAMLYHVNIGPPVAVPGAVVRVPSDSWTPSREVKQVPVPSPLPEPCDEIIEAVFTHSAIREDADGWARAVVSRPGSAIELEVAWKPEGLPHLHQWVYPTAGRWALAIEPATAPLFGVERESSGRGIPLLEQGGFRRHEIMITARESS
jgi:hypothetical protein